MIKSVEGLSGPARRAALIAIIVAVAMASLDTSVTNTALPTIAGALKSSDADAVWVANAYQIAMVAVLLPLAALGEIAGHRRVYIFGLVLFTMASVVCGLAWSLSGLVAARALQGLGAAAIMSVNTALIRFVYPDKMLGRGLGLNALVVAVGFAVGPTVASAVLAVGSWPWLFLINVPAGIVAIVLSVRALPVTERARHRFDGLSGGLCAGFFALLILGIGGVSHGGSWAVTGGEWVTAAVCGYLLVRRQAGHPAPMLAIDLFRKPVFTLSTLTSICSFTTQGLAFVSLPFLFQVVLGRNEIETGVVITVWPVVVAVMAPIAGRLSDRYSAGILGGAGLLMLSGGMASLALLPAAPSAAGIACRMGLCGVGFGFFQSPNLRALMANAAPGRSGAASGVVAVARLLGQATGAALVALCLTLSGDRGAELSLWLGCGFSLLGSIASFLRVARPGTS